MTKNKTNMTALTHLIKYVQGNFKEVMKQCFN